MSRVLVIGAGYAGAHAARAARDGGADVTVIAPQGRHDLTPRLATVAAGAAPLGDGFASLADLVDDVEVRSARVASVETDLRTVTLEDGTSLPYDALVVTVGSAPAEPDIPGLLEHARPLRTAADAATILRSLALTDRIVIVGGGATGTQLAGEIAAEHRDVSVTLVEAEDRLMGSLGDRLGAHAERLLERRGVRVLLGRQVARFHERSVELHEGPTLVGLPIWCGGFAPTGHDLLPGAPSISGRLKVDRYLRSAAGPGVFVAGDAAAHRDLLGRPLAMSAQIAVQAGKAAGANAARVATGQRPQPARLLDLGWVATLGGGRGVAKVGPLHLAAPLVDRVVPLLHHAVDVRHLFQLGGLPAVAAHAPGMNDLTTAEERAFTRSALRVVADAG